MTGEEFGERVATLRKQRGMSQRELAAEVKRSESWVSQVERGVYHVERISVLQSLADALGVSMQELRTDAASPAPATVVDPVPDLGTLRLALSGHPALAVLLSPPVESVNVDVPSLARRVDDAWSMEHAGEYVALNESLPAVIADLERTSRIARDSERPELLALLARAYQVTSATFSRCDEPDASWLAADRAIAAADRAGQPLHAIAGHFRMAHAFMRLNQMAQAEHVATTAADALKPRVARSGAEPEELSLYGALNLVMAIIKARESDRVGAKNHLANARKVAERLGVDRNDFNTEFGPTNVQLHALAVAVDVGDAGEALDLAAVIDPSRLSAERQARFWLDVARAHAQRRHIGDSVAALRRAEELAPEQIRGHHFTHETVALLVKLAGKRPPAELIALAQRTASDA